VLGVNLDGQRDVLGHWVGDGAEGANFWLTVVSDLQARGVDDIFIACIDGLSGFKDALLAVFPHTHMQRCIIHQVRHSLRYVSWKDHKAFVADLKAIYQAPTREAAETNLLRLGEKWGATYAVAVRSWEAHWDDLATMFDYRADSVNNEIGWIHPHFRCNWGTILEPTRCMATRSRRLADALLPPSSNLYLNHVEYTDTAVTIQVSSTAPTAACPQCRQCASRIRGTYIRTLADLPWSSRSVRLQVRVRTFACDVPHCPQCIFAERLPHVAVPYARRTARCHVPLDLVK